MRMNCDPGQTKWRAYPKKITCVKTITLGFTSGLCVTLLVKNRINNDKQYFPVLLYCLWVSINSLSHVVEG